MLVHELAPSRKCPLRLQVGPVIYGFTSHACMRLTERGINPYRMLHDLSEHDPADFQGCGKARMPSGVACYSPTGWTIISVWYPKRTS